MRYFSECPIRGWKEEAFRDLDRLLFGENPEWLGESWTRADLSDEWMVSRQDGGIFVLGSGDDYAVNDLAIALQAVMRHHGIGGTVRIDSWSEEDDDFGSRYQRDGQSTYVCRYGSMRIDPQVCLERESVIDALHRMERDAVLMKDPMLREAELGPSANVLAAEKDGTVFLAPGNFPGKGRHARVLDIAAAGDAHAIVANAAQLFPSAKAIEPRGLPKDIDFFIRTAAEEWGLSRKDASRPRGRPGM